MTQLYTFSSLYKQIKTQKSAFWRTNFYGVLTTLFLLPIPMLIPLLIDEVLLEHPGKMTEIFSKVFTSSRSLGLYYSYFSAGTGIAFNGFCF